AIMFFLHILILYHLLEEVIFTLYYLYTTTKPVVYHWKYRLDEIDPSEKVVVDTLPIKKSS
ncbi:hypothetical protein ACTNEY_15715, partial [Fusicatenibacter saccharivorans]